MKIIKLKSENIKKIKAIEIEPKSHLIKISGANGQGKTSVLDSITMALGGAALIPEQPIRHGEKKAKIEVMLGEKTVELVVTRSFTEKTSTLTIEDPDGKIFKSPQKLLDGIVGKLSFDPLALLALESKKLNDELKKIIGVNTDVIDGEIRNAYDERTAINKKIKYATNEIIALGETPPPEEPKHTSEIIKRISEAVEINKMNQSRRTKISNILDNLKKHEAMIEDNLRQIENSKKYIQDQDRLLIEMGVPGKDVDISTFESQLAEFEAHNVQVSENNRKIKLKNDAALVIKRNEAIEQALTKKIETLREEKTKALSLILYPVNGMSVDDGNVLFHCVPIDQCSDSEKLRLCVGVAMAMNPKLRIVRLTNASLLDSKSVAIIEEMAIEKDYDIWMEVVDESGKIGIVISDGSIESINEEEP